MIRQWSWLVLLLCILVAGWPVARGADNEGPRPTDRPHIILINLDDADRDVLEVDFLDPQPQDRFPNMTQMANGGRRFSNFHVTSPLCGPSRACLLTGQYAHQTRFMTNDASLVTSRGVTGDFSAYHGAGSDGRRPPFWGNDLGRWMQDAGYHTMYVGKYLHGGYDPRAAGVSSWTELHPPGWGDFFVSLGGDYFRAPIVRNGQFIDLRNSELKSPDDIYRTLVEGRDVQRLIRRHVTSDSRPFFMYWAPFAPHREARSTADILEQQAEKGMVEPRYRSMWSDATLLPADDFDLDDLSGKPRTIQQLPRLAGRQAEAGFEEQELMNHLFRRRMLAVRTVDDVLGEVRQLLKTLRIEDQTIVIITSDNGYHLGHTRVYGKATPYHRSSNVPAIVWGPQWVDACSEPLDHLIAHIDLAPTLVELAGGTVPDQVQGQSFVPLLRGDPPRPESWRPQGLLVEQWELTPCRGQMLATTFCSLRLYNEVYTQWANGDREYYRTDQDPLELNNAIGELNSDTEARFVERISALREGLSQPRTFCESPFASSAEVSHEFVVQGIADYRSPIERVELTVVDLSAPRVRYWNGSQWIRQPASVMAELSNPGGVLTEWQYRVTLSEPIPNQLHITASAIGADGVRDEQGVSRNLIVLGEQPWCLIVDPPQTEAAELDAAGTLTIAGWAEDASTVRNVRLVIADRQRQLFWNGTEWQSGSTSVVANLQRQRGSNRVDWSLSFQPGQREGDIEVIPRVLTRDREQAVRRESRTIRYFAR